MVQCDKRRADLEVDGVYYRLSSLIELRCLKPRAQRGLKGLKFVRDVSAIEREFRDAEKTGIKRPS